MVQTHLYTAIVQFVVSLCLGLISYCSMQAIQNLGLAVVAIVAGKILDEKGYLVLLVFFMACLCGKLAI